MVELTYPNFGELSRSWTQWMKLTVDLEGEVPKASEEAI